MDELEVSPIFQRNVPTIDSLSNALHSERSITRLRKNIKEISDHISNNIENSYADRWNNNVEDMLIMTRQMEKLLEKLEQEHHNQQEHQGMISLMKQILEKKE